MADHGGPAGLPYLLSIMRVVNERTKVIVTNKTRYWSAMVHSAIQMDGGMIQGGVHRLAVTQKPSGFTAWTLSNEAQWGEPFDEVVALGAEMRRVFK